MSGLIVDIEVAHSEACRRGEDTYADPKTGYSVFTKSYLERRRKCCGNGCRHCPYGHFNVPVEYKKTLNHEKITHPTLLRSRSSQLGLSGRICVVFWSAGKNSFLSMRRMCSDLENHNEKENIVVLFTIFNPDDESLPYQGVKIHHVMEQAKAMKIDLFLVPQRDPSNNGYKNAVMDGLTDLERKVNEVRMKKLKRDSIDVLNVSIVFGDVTNESCRIWRETMFHNTKYDILFPLWELETKAMLQELKSIEGCQVEVIRFSENESKAGNIYNEDFVQELPPNYSKIGENGEFDTIVKIL